MTNSQQTDMDQIGFSLIDINLIDDPSKPLRSDLTPDSVSDLVLSIKQMGIIEPLIVKHQGERFEIIAGHRRLVAAQIAQLEQVPCVIKKLGVEETEIMKLHENIYRVDIRPSDEAKHFDYLIQHLKLSPAKIAQLVGRSGSYVSERLAIFNYPPILREALDSKKIVFSVAREFARHPNIEKIKQFTRYAVSNGCTPNIARQWVNDDIREFEQRTNPLTENLGSLLDEQVENPSYNCVLCSEPVEIQHLTIAYMHDSCHKSVTAAESSGASRPSNSETEPEIVEQSSNPPLAPLANHADYDILPNLN